MLTAVAEQSGRNSRQCQIDDVGGQSLTWLAPRGVIPLIVADGPLQTQHPARKRAHVNPINP